MTTSDEVKTDRRRYQILGGDRIRAESRQIKGGDTVLRWTIDDAGLEDLFLKLYALPVPQTTEDPAMDAIVNAIESECTYVKVIVMTDDDRLIEQRWTSDGQYYRERGARERAAYEADFSKSEINEAAQIVWKAMKWAREAKGVEGLVDVPFPEWQTHSNSSAQTEARRAALLILEAGRSS